MMILISTGHRRETFRHRRMTKAQEAVSLMELKAENTSDSLFNSFSVSICIWIQGRSSYSITTCRNCSLSSFSNMETNTGPAPLSLSALPGVFQPPPNDAISSAGYTSTWRSHLLLRANHLSIKAGSHSLLLCQVVFGQMLVVPV